MRLIDADALRKEHCEGCTPDIQQDCKTDPICASLMWVHDAPTIDAVPVVRCKDCANYGGIDGVFGSGYCYYWEFEPHTPPNTVDEDGFCSHGERRSE